MVVTIIGSLKCKENILDAKKHFESLGHEVYCPLDKELQSKSLLEIQQTWIYSIKKADLVVVIPKTKGMEGNASSEYNFGIGESTSYEMAICTYLNKRFVIWFY